MTTRRHFRVWSGSLTSSSASHSFVTIRLTLRSGALAALLGWGCLLGPACSAERCRGPDCDCIDERRLDDGTCCSAWTYATHDGCLVRAWSLVEPALGEPGAQRLSLQLDGENAGLAAWQIAGATQADRRIMLAQEQGPEASFEPDPSPSEAAERSWSLQFPGEGLEGSGLAPRVAAGEDQRALLTWTQQVQSDGTVYLSTRDTDGQWNHPTQDEPLSFPPRANEPRPIIAPSGEALVVWSQLGPGGFGVALARRSSEDPDGPFIRPADNEDVLSPAVSILHAPHIAVAGNGDATITWAQTPALAPEPGSELMVFVSTRTRESGPFSRPELDDFISPEGGEVDSPVVSMSPWGEILVAWTQHDGRGAVPVYLARRGSIGGWETPTSLQDTFSDPTGRAQSPRLAHTDAGEVFVLWSADRGDGDRIFAAHRQADGEWDVPGTSAQLLSSPGAEAIHPRLALGPDGMALMVWQERNDDGPWRVRARRRTPGADDWGPIEAVSPEEGPDATNPEVDIGPSGRALAGWIEGPPLQGRARFAVID